MMDRDIATRELELARLRSARHAILVYLQSGGDHAAVRGAVRGPAASGVVRGPSQHAAAEQVLRAVGAPMATRAIAERMIADGLYTGKLDAARLSNSLYRAFDRMKDRFASTQKGVWGLREWLEGGADRTAQ